MAVCESEESVEKMKTIAAVEVEQDNERRTQQWSIPLMVIYSSGFYKENVKMFPSFMLH